MIEEVRFGPLVIRFDDSVLRPRAWTLAQSEWGAELLDRLPPGPVCELCAGAGQIGLAAVAGSSRDVVLVDIDAGACSYARFNADVAANADVAGFSARVDVRHGPMEKALRPTERFSLILADPPWVRSDDVGEFPGDPVTAIDGGADGLDLARLCVDVIARHLGDEGAAILQLGDLGQVEAIGAEMSARPELGLRITDARQPEGNGFLVRLDRS